MLTWWKIKLNFRAFVRWPSTPANKALPRAADLICRFLMLLPNNHHEQAPPGDAYSLSNRATLYYGWQIFIENIDPTLNGPGGRIEAFEHVAHTTVQEVRGGW